MYHLLFGKKLWRLWRPLSKKLREQEQAAPRLQIYSTSDTLSTFWREKYVKDARKYWDVFYKRHQDKGAGRKVILEVVVELETIFPLVAIVSREDAYVMKNNRKVLKERLNCKDQKISEIFYVRGDGTETIFRLSDDTNSSTKTEAATEVDHLGQEKIVLEVNEKILKKPVNDLEVDISDGVVMEMSGVLPSNDNELGSWLLFNQKSNSGGICSMVATISADLVFTTDGDSKALDLLKRNADISGQTDYKKIRVGNRDHIEAIKEANSQGFDIILGTDVTYVAEAILPLFQTAKEWISSDRSTAEDSEPALIFVIFSFL
ncbi:hypothetical protein DVH24_012665 [Malus domestica]|uniref:Uncharacterized protein n=1 Tax=Malus domestica TaxID=3750 RepID=A0A498HUY1_MALDO|nr:hypothetical protein DVH24_012665 [Malus domestica]